MSTFCPAECQQAYHFVILLNQTDPLTFTARFDKILLQAILKCEIHIEDEIKSLLVITGALIFVMLVVIMAI